MKRHKSAGVDGIQAEFALDAADLLMNSLVLRFSQILEGETLVAALQRHVSSCSSMTPASNEWHPGEASVVLWS